MARGRSFSKNSKKLRLDEPKNIWVKKSIDLVMDPDSRYLDRIFEVYPVHPEKREIPDLKMHERIIAKLLKAARKSGTKVDNSKIALISYLIFNFEKFPVDYPYVSFLRRLKSYGRYELVVQYLKKNPTVTSKIFELVDSLDFEGIIAGITEPKKANRLFGVSKSNIITFLYNALKDDHKDNQNITIELVDTSDELLNKKYPGVYILKGSDKSLLEFAKTQLGYHRENEKGLDLVLKIVTLSKKVVYLIGEAKFFTDSGGHQGRQRDDAFLLLNSEFTPKDPDSKVIPVAILDGAIWIENKQKGHLQVRDLPPNKVALSFLVLKDFVNCILMEDGSCVGLF